MDAREAYEEAVRNLRGAGLGAVRELCWRSYLRYARDLPADPVLDADWDLLVVLDACRADLWAELADEHSLPTGATRISPGGTSTEWLDAVFGAADPGALSGVGYVTANPFSTGHAPDALGHVAEVWRDGWDDDLRTTPPAAVTEAAVQVGREHDGLDRLVVHYMQPHFPAVAGELAGEGGVARDDFGEESLSVWEDLRFGRRSPGEVWRAYRENLRAVVPEVETLLANVDADRAVITADHGNAFGEHGVYGHAAGLALRPLREVPWVVTSASDEGTLDPDADADREPEPGPEESADDEMDADVEQRLRDLGYR